MTSVYMRPFIRFITFGVCTIVSFFIENYNPSSINTIMM